jgi:hypothetical protein
MFNFFKPAQVRLRKSLPSPLHREYDEVLSSFSPAVPSYWSKGAQDRAITMVMAQWVISNALAGRLNVPRQAYAKAMQYAAICYEHNERDFEHGGSSSALASDIIRALEEADIIPRS